MWDQDDQNSFRTGSGLKNKKGGRWYGCGRHFIQRRKNKRINIVGQFQIAHNQLVFKTIYN